MDETSGSLIEITSFTDPYCTWCWGSEPILRRIEHVYADQVSINFKMGGLVKNIHQFHDYANNIGGSEWYRQVARHWLEASQRHGMPVDEKVWYDIKNDFISTHPANIAFKAAEFQDTGTAKKFLRRMREAAAAERKPIHNVEVQAMLAQEVGLEHEQFLEDIKNGKAENAFKDDLRECHLRGATAFPTFLISTKDREIMLRGYQKFEGFELAFRELAGDILKLNPVQVDEQSILAFVLKYKKVAPTEIVEVFGLNMETAMEWLSQLKGKGFLKEQKAGNGFFYSVQENILACDAEARICLTSETKKILKEYFMSEPNIPKKGPYITEEQPGEVYWCSCGRSKNQPYCDGSHEGTEFQPMAVKVEKVGKVAWCGCKHSSNKPYCDGSHTKL